MNNSKTYDIRKEFKIALFGHVSQETAYVNKAYRRYKFIYWHKRYWIERGDCISGTRKANRDLYGERLVTQNGILKLDTIDWCGPKAHIYNWVECLYLDHNNIVDSYGFHRKTFTYDQVKIMKDLFSSVMDDYQTNIVDELLDMYRIKDNGK